MNTQSFSKTWLIVILLAVVVGGILAHQYFEELRKLRERVSYPQPLLRIADPGLSSLFQQKIKVHEAEIEVEILTEDLPPSKENFNEIGVTENFQRVYQRASEKNVDWVFNPLRLIERYLNEETWYGRPRTSLNPPQVKFFPFLIDQELRKGTAIITVTGFFDDSVNGEQMRIDLLQEEKKWRIEWVGIRWRCWPGRGSTYWTNERLCY